MDLYSIGEILIDFLPGNEPGSYIRNAGGAPANCAVAAARCGLDVGFCGLLGDDDFGWFLRRSLEENMVRVLCQRMTGEAVTTMAFVTLGEDGERTFTFARKPGADMLLAVADVRDADIHGSAIVHSGSCSLSKGPAADATLHALRRGHELGKLVSFDVNYRAMLWGGDSLAAARMVRKALPYVSLLKTSDDETHLLGSDIPSLMEEFGIELVVETLGAKGACCYHRGHTLSAACPDVPRVVDATGAGDAFWGAFLASLVHQGVRQAGQLDAGIISRALREGNVAGSLCVQKKGAISSLPTRAQILLNVE